jgi:putative transposase
MRSCARRPRFRAGGARPPTDVMMTFIDQYRETFGVESICATLPIAPSTSFRGKAQQREPTRRWPRAQRDEVLRPAIRRVWDAHFAVYGVRTVWRQLRRKGVEVARCTVQRLMRDMGLVGARRGRTWVTTTHQAVAADHPRDSAEYEARYCQQAAVA